MLRNRLSHIRKILERPGPFCPLQFEASPDILQILINTFKILVIGAGGLGCELLKDLALMGFGNIHVIDMDTIELSNLNRQFLFTKRDIGKSKAEVAASFINTRIPGCCVVPHFNKIQDFGENFYQQFHIVVCGLDSIIARRWINGMLISLLNYEDGALNTSSLIPIIDAGTEGFKGNVRVIIPGSSACIECTLDLYPPQVTYPLCTIASAPRLPEHCIEYVKVIQWPKENPWNIPINGDNPQHIGWIYDKSINRAAQFSIPGVTYRLVQGVVKNIIPAVASTNAVIAAACATEAFKIATNCVPALNNFMVFNNLQGVYTYTYEAERKEDCLACSQIPQIIQLSGDTKLEDLITILCESAQFRMKSPGLRARIDGTFRTLYMSTVSSIEEKTRKNLHRSFRHLGLNDGDQLLVADATSPNPIVLHLKFTDDCMEQDI